jgi:SAM-dependent methyltransferase
MTSASVPQIFERRQYAAKMARGRHRQRHHGGASYLTDTMAGDVVERLDFMRFEPEKALVIGDVAGKLLQTFDEAGTRCAQGRLGEFDEESPGPAQAFDLVVHLLGLAMVNDLPGALIHGRNAVAEGGLFIAAMPGAGSLPALRQIALAADGERPAARLHPLVDLRGATGLMERAGFRRQVVDSYPRAHQSRAAAYPRVAGALRSRVRHLARRRGSQGHGDLRDPRPYRLALALERGLRGGKPCDRHAVG